MKSIVLYGLKSEKDAYQCTRYEILGCERMSVTDLLFTASDFADHYGVSIVYAVNDSHNLRDHYRDAIREHHTEQDSIDFKIYLDQVGIRVY